MQSAKKLLTKEPWKAAVIKPKTKDWTEVATNTLVDVGAGVGGGYGGSFLGKWSIPVGLTLSVVGHATGQRWLSALGIGCIAAPCDTQSSLRVAADSGFSLKAEYEAGKARSKDYIEMLKEKFFINKFMGKNKPADAPAEETDTPTVNGLDPGVEKATLDRLTSFDQQILSDGIEYEAKNRTAADGGAYAPVNGVGVELDELPHII